MERNTALSQQVYASRSIFHLCHRPTWRRATHPWSVVLPDSFTSFIQFKGLRDTQYIQMRRTPSDHVWSENISAFNCSNPLWCSEPAAIRPNSCFTGPHNPSSSNQLLFVSAEFKTSKLRYFDNLTGSNGSVQSRLPPPTELRILSGVQMIHFKGYKFPL